MWERRSKTIFWSTVLLSGFIFFQMIMHASHLTFHWSPGFNIFEICSSWIQSLGLSFAVYLMNALVICTLLHCCWLAVKQAYLVRRAVVRLERSRNEELTQKVTERYRLNQGSIIVTDHSEAVAMTMGFVRPQIVISAGLIQLINEAELEAVLLHEQYHLTKRHPFKSFLTLWFSSSLWFIPILSWWHRYYKITLEVLADKFAIQVKGAETDLGSALLKLMKRNQASIQAAHSAFADTSVNYRIKHMIDPEAELKFHLPWHHQLLSYLVIIFLTGLFVLLGR
ncbi:M56 family metallopeptidase [Paenibacillus sp. GD4]|uniref:M56 family metallopeptidase n=1 Tax=Paenibacillus sp. GD4 TaxID=3068890 RepID=UPI002796C248|nr:M56 family metallopeptidase [Paenibacillus sp. GD4]MDQ1909034.1 M56 family metallopeptidase [Paenibacillus sp. GD4]